MLRLLSSGSFFWIVVAPVLSSCSQPSTPVAADCSAPETCVLDCPEGAEMVWVWSSQEPIRAVTACKKGSTNHGPSVTWHSNGTKHIETTHVEGMLHGKHIEWHENGTKHIETQHWAGLQHGKAIGWHENGEKKSEREYNAGKPLLKHIEWHKDGPKKVELQRLEDGQKHAEGATSPL